MISNLEKRINIVFQPSKTESVEFKSETAQNTVENEQTSNLSEFLHLHHDRLLKESSFLTAYNTDNVEYYAHFNLPSGFNGTIIPVFLKEPSSIIAYTLSSLEYQCVMYGLQTSVRSCRERGEPSVLDLEKKVLEKMVCV